VRLELLFSFQNGVTAKVEQVYWAKERGKNPYTAIQKCKKSTQQLNTIIGSSLSMVDDD
jgi:hypothetical protein